MATCFYYTKTLNTARSERIQTKTEKGKVKTELQAVSGISVGSGLLKIDFDRNQLSDPQCWGQIFILDHVLRTKF